MTSQMYVDLIAQELIEQTKNEGKISPFRFPVVGTLAGPVVLIDAIPQPIPFSDFQLLVDEHTSVKPTYEDGDRLLIIPISDGGHWIIVGRLI